MNKVRNIAHEHHTKAPMDIERKVESPLLETLKEANMAAGRYEHSLLGLLRRRRMEREAERKRLVLLKIADSGKGTAE